METRSTSGTTFSRGALGLAIAVAFVLACGGGTKASGQPLTLTLAADDGTKIRTADSRGKILVVHVFTTWSMPAQDDALRLQRELGTNKAVSLLGVALDKEARQVIAAWRRGTQITYPIALATDAIRFGDSPLGDASAVPFTIVFDRDGRQLTRISTPLGEDGIKQLRQAANL